ncbi:hypothetical protein [Bacteroides fragilis]|nr:hypothetical protein [Bacteroides fragilis]
MRKKKIQILLSAAAFLFLMGGTMPSVAQDIQLLSYICCHKQNE